MRKNLIFLMAVAVALSFSTAAFAEAESPFFIRGIRPLGMGGAFVAVADDENAVFYNPAGLTQRTGGQFILFDLPIDVGTDIFDFYKFFNDNQDDLKNFDKLSNARQIALLDQINGNIVSLRPNLRLGFPNLSYLSKPGFLAYGFGIFNQEEIGFQFNRSLIIPSISYWGNADTMLGVPVAHKFTKLPFIPGSISAGATLKYIYRGKISELNRSVLEFDNLDPVVQFGSGFGADLGGLYQLNDRWNFGLQITDLNGTNISFPEVTSTKAGEPNRPAYTGSIPSQMNVGTAYVPSKITYWIDGRSISTKDRVIFALDLRDISNSDEPLTDSTFWKKVHMGVEYRLSTLSLRGGFGSGYPSIGVGVRVPYLGLRLEYAYWGQELGRYAGQLPEYNHQINIALSWGDANGRPYGSSVNQKMESNRPREKVKPKETLTPSTTQQTTLNKGLASPTTAQITAAKGLTQATTQQMALMEGLTSNATQQAQPAPSQESIKPTPVQSPSPVVTKPAAPVQAKPKAAKP
jgi:hypothetical protein